MSAIDFLGWQPPPVAIQNNTIHSQGSNSAKIFDVSCNEDGGEYRVKRRKSLRPLTVFLFCGPYEGMYPSIYEMMNLNYGNTRVPGENV